VKIVKREIRLEFIFTLGPGEMEPAEADALAQLTALATKMNGGVLPRGLVDGLAHRPSTTRVMPWHCGNCPGVGETYRGAASHARFNPKHALVYET